MYKQVYSKFRVRIWIDEICEDHRGHLQSYSCDDLFEPTITAEFSTFEEALQFAETLDKVSRHVRRPDDKQK